ncbi:MAG: hypothetical protein GXP15_05500 [Gammaproteobacteria bacterium]|nr:hypothetical protein [Gammaproteobacteria bacterium]
MRIPISVIMIACFGPLSLADENERAAGNDDTEVEDSEEATVVEEIVVFANRPGNPVDLDKKYGNLLRRRIIKDLERLQVLNEEFEWRSSGKTTGKDQSRIKWGYDPRDQNRVRQNSRMTDLPIDDTKPATIFSIDF